MHQGNNNGATSGGAMHARLAVRSPSPPLEWATDEGEGGRVLDTGRPSTRCRGRDAAAGTRTIAVGQVRFWWSLSESRLDGLSLCHASKVGSRPCVVGDTRLWLRQEPDRNPSVMDWNRNSMARAHPSKH